LTAVGADVHLLAGPQVEQCLEPLAGVGVAVVVVGGVQAKRFEFGQEPATNDVDRQSSAGDVGDVTRELGEYQRVDQQRLDRADELYAARGLGQRGQRRPGLEHVVLDVAGMNDMLRQQG
jgi:hypothetical protein